MGRPIREGQAAIELRVARQVATRALIERERSVCGAARAIDVDRHMIRAWLGNGLAIPTGDHEVAIAVRARRDQLVRDTVRRADGLVKRAATMLGVSRQTMKRWMLDVGMYHPTPSLTRSRRSTMGV